MVGQADERKPQHGTVLQVERAGALRLKELLDLTQLGRRIERSRVEFLPVRRPRVTDDLQRELHSLRASESGPQDLMAADDRFDCRPECARPGGCLRSGPNLEFDRPGFRAAGGKVAAAAARFCSLLSEVSTYLLIPMAVCGVEGWLTSSIRSFQA